MKTKTFLNGIEATDRSEIRIGPLSGRSFDLPDRSSGYPQCGMIGRDGRVIDHFERGDGHPDVTSHRAKLGLLLPATNTVMEYELWDILIRNRDRLPGIGIHTSLIATPSAKFGNAEELAQYRKEFLGNAQIATHAVLLGDPHYLIMGFSMEHFSAALEENEALPLALEQSSGLSMATWARACKAALDRFGARRIGLICPFDATGLANAVEFFDGMGFEVASAVGLGCASGVDVGHVPDAYKEKAIREQLLPVGNLDAIVQCGTNLASVQLAEKLKPELDLPLIGVNAALLWYSLRELGFDQPLQQATRLFRAF